MQNDSIYQYLLKCAVSLFLGVAIIIPRVHAATLTNEFIEKPGEPAGLTMNNSLKLEFENGSVLRINEIKDKHGTTLGFGISETSRHASRRISNHDLLKRSNPVDVLWAVTTGGTRLPDALLKAYGAPDRSQQQGWARTELGLNNPPSEGGGTICDEQQGFPGFSNDILDFGYGLVFLSDYDGPISKPQHWFLYDHPAIDEYEYFRLTGVVYDVRAFYTQVSYCYADVNYSMDENDPSWVYDYRLAGGQWETFDGDQFYLGGTDSFWWHPVELSWSLPGTELDFRIRIGSPLPGNMFRIGATWSKPFDTLSFSK